MQSSCMYSRQLPSKVGLKNRTEMQMLRACILAGAWQEGTLYERVLEEVVTNQHYEHCFVT